MSEWKKVKLGDVCEITSSKRIFMSDYVDQGIPFYRSKEIAELQNGDSISTPFFISKEKYEDIKAKYGIPQKGDLLLTAIGATLGIPFVIKDNSPFYFKDGNLIWFKCFDENYDSSFLYYWMLTDFGYQSMLNVAIGSAQKALTISALKGLEITFPSVTIQHRIATILSPYDSLIENYQKQIKLLEEAAQRLYKEWFVDLRFPGHEITKIVDGVPEGWEKKTVESLLVKHMNGGWGKDSSTGSNITEAPVIRGTDIAKIKNGVFDDLPTRFHTQKDILNKHLEPNDIILELSNGNINNVGRTLLIDESTISQCGENVICASFCKFLRPIDYRTAIIMSLEFEEMQLGDRMRIFKKNGTNGINNFDFQGFLKHELILPPKHLSIKLFEEYTKSISNHRTQIRLLTEARDRLLPKLMGGEIEV